MIKSLRYPWYKSLYFRSLLLVAIWLGSIFVLYTFFTIHRESARIVESVESKANLVAVITADALALPLWNFDDRQVQKEFASLSYDTDYCGARIFDQTENTLYSDMVEHSELQEHVHARKDISFESLRGLQNLGTLELCFSYAAAQDDVREEAWALSGISSLLFLMTLTAVSLTWRWVLTPLRRMEKEIEVRAKNLSPIEDPILNRENEIGVLTNVLNNLLADLATTQQSLILAKEKAEDASKAKSAFLANMSHELRTPMHAILSYSKLGIDRMNENNPEKTEKYFENIQQSGHRLLKLLNSLLDLSKLEAGKMQIQYSEMNWKSFLTKVKDEMAGLLQQKQQRLHIRINVKDEKFYADAEKMMQVFVNLLGNATKFSGTGKNILIEVHEEETTEATSKKILVRIIDEGVGIPESELETIFGKFNQSSATRSAAGGTGLGLAISKEIILAHQGEIWASNHSNGGACFSILLPAQPAVAEAALREDEPSYF